VLLAFDGSATGYKTVQMLAESPLCQNLPAHSVMVGAESNDSLAHLHKAKAILVAAGFDVHAEIRQGEV
jgi:predicted transcriptional regulator